MADVLTYAGLAVLTDALDGLTWYLGWGEGPTAAARSATTLSTAATEAREVVALARETVAQTNDTLKCTVTMTGDGSKTITNAGVFDAAGAGSPPTGGTLILLSSFTGLPVTLASEVTFVFRLRFK